MSTNRSSITPYVNALLNDSIILTALTDSALEALDIGKAGHPTQVPGANPDTSGVAMVLLEVEACTAVVHGVWPCICHAAAREASTQTERAALAPDQAKRDERLLLKHIKAAQLHTTRAATLAQQWATPMLDKSTVQKRLATIDAGIWCTNHNAHGMMEPRRHNRHLCDLCERFQAQYKQPAPFEVLDFVARGGRLDERRARYLIGLARDRKNAADAKSTPQRTP